MRTYLSEKNLVVLLFILVLVVFTIAQSETQKMGKGNAALLSAAQKSGIQPMVWQPAQTNPAHTANSIITAN